MAIVGFVKLCSPFRLKKINSSAYHFIPLQWFKWFCSLMAKTWKVVYIPSHMACRASCFAMKLYIHKTGPKHFGSFQDPWNNFCWKTQEEKQKFEMRYYLATTFWSRYKNQTWPPHFAREGIESIAFIFGSLWTQQDGSGVKVKYS